MKIILVFAAIAIFIWAIIGIWWCLDHRRIVPSLVSMAALGWAYYCSKELVKCALTVSFNDLDNIATSSEVLDSLDLYTKLFFMALLVATVGAWTYLEDRLGRPKEAKAAAADAELPPQDREAEEQVPDLPPQDREVPEWVPDFSVPEQKK